MAKRVTGHGHTTREVGEPGPTYKHKCRNCFYLGHTFARFGPVHDDNVKRFDLYICNNTLHAKYGDTGDQEISGRVERVDHTDAVLFVAKTLAQMFGRI